MGIVAYALYWLLYKIPAKEINKEYDLLIKTEPHKEELFNMLRNLAIYKEKDAQKNMEKYLTIKVQEELMYDEYDTKQIENQQHLKHLKIKKQ